MRPSLLPTLPPTKYMCRIAGFLPGATSRGMGPHHMPLSSWLLPGLESLSYLSVPLIATSFRLVSHIPKTLFLTGFASFFLALLKDGLLEFLTQPFLLTSLTSLFLTW